MKSLPALKIGQHTVRYPIVQGAMAVRVSGANLVGAIANAGGMGVISAIGLGLQSPHFAPFFEGQTRRHKGQFVEANRLALIEELQRARSISPTGIIGVNVVMAMRDYAISARAAAEQGANVIIASAGLPLDLPEHTADFPDVALVPVIACVESAIAICDHWQRQYGRSPDALILACPQTSGGHVGVSQDALDDAPCNLFPTLQDLLAYLKRIRLDIPVIASGGIWDRTDIDRMLSYGASGVQIGTRFILTEECDAHPRYKEFHLQAKPQDVVLVPSPVGVPGRALRNAFTQQVLQHDRHHSETEDICIANCLKVCRYRDRKETYCLIQALDRAARGDVETGLIFSGSHARQGDRIQSVAALMAELTQS